MKLPALVAGGVGADPLQFAAPHDRETIARSHFAHDVVHVVLHGLLGKIKLRGDLFVGEPVRGAIPQVVVPCDSVRFDLQGFADPALPGCRLARQSLMALRSRLSARRFRSDHQGRAHEAAALISRHQHVGPGSHSNYVEMKPTEHQWAGIVSIKTRPCDGILSATDALFTLYISGGESFEAARSLPNCSLVG